MSKFDLILARVVKIMGLFIGSGIMIYETVADHHDRPYLYAAALMMMGLQIAEVVERIASGFGSKASTVEQGIEAKHEQLERKK